MRSLKHVNFADFTSVSQNLFHDFHPGRASMKYLWRLQQCVLAQEHVSPMSEYGPKFRSMAVKRCKNLTVEKT